jgi:putative transposase
MNQGFVHGANLVTQLELAYAVIDGVQARGEKGNYSTHHVKFNSYDSD